jgi:hypothetical protein
MRSGGSGYGALPRVLLRAGLTVPVVGWHAQAWQQRSSLSRAPAALPPHFLNRLHDRNTARRPVTVSAAGATASDVTRRGGSRPAIAAQEAPLLPNA